jgi:hypothetical protein
MRTQRKGVIAYPTPPGFCSHHTYFHFTHQKEKTLAIVWINNFEPSNDRIICYQKMIEK